ncbi:MAG: ATP-binding protein, partial [Desulfobulbaceae bacterium]|nr:ATP-binding protein [Desulfobulbaceae bacterium]
MENQYPYEKLGLFFLGRELDIDGHEPSHLPLLYKNKNLTTHAAIIGMTGSGKTGLGIALIEEAIMDNVPSIIIDPKGDMGNLLLSFPDLRAGDFYEWIDPASAAAKDLSTEDYAEQVAQTWRSGLASWGQSGDRIRMLREKTDMTIYTPGSTAGVSVSVLSSFNAPAEKILNDTDTLNSLVNSTTTSLLALIDVTGDPLQSREHILLSSLLLYFWRKGENLSLEDLIGNIVNPPFDRVGVFPLDTFYGQSKRMDLAMGLNNILASPTFAAWTQGVPLDIQRILYSESGRPQTAIFSIAHLSETERMFFVTMLLNQFTGWMRRQQGSSSLKALLYMDEIFGYFPPTANPPSKKPMLLLLKQARAFGVGIVLATQNPVDLDYKGLSNIGTWFVGRLQTSQDQDRVVEGIVGASDGNLDVRLVRSLLSDMKGRQFLLNSVHIEEPLLFETRWVMSYLKGPISKIDIKKLMERKKNAISSMEYSESFSSESPSSGTNTLPGNPPLLGRGIEQLYFLQNVMSDETRFEPWLWA